jgi:hypothetical protein
MVEERSESRKRLYWKQLRDAKLGLFIWRSPGCGYVDVRELEDDQIERAIIHFEKRTLECRSELLRRAGEPKPNFWLTDNKDEWPEH